jgi:hypothetical protein
LTDGTFDAPYDPDNDVEKNQYIGRLDPKKAEEFRKKAAERMADTNKEIERMKAKHAKRLAKFQKGSLLFQAEKDLRTAVADPTDIGPEYWRLEGRIDEDDSEDGKAVQTIPSKVEDILAQVEASLGRSAVAVEELRRIQDGGFEEAAPASPSPIPAAPSPKPASNHSLPQSLNGGTPQSGVLGTDGEMDMGNSAAGLLDQYHSGISSNATPASNFGNTPQPLMQPHSGSGTPDFRATSPHPLAHVSPQPEVPASTQGDVNMSEATEQAVSADGSGTGDWVVVPPGGVSPVPTTTTTGQVEVPTAPVLEIPTMNDTPADDYNGSPNDFADLDDLDTAGDAMASYRDDSPGMGLDVDMDDSAFGEAFHGVEARDEGSDGHIGDGL